jgi:hypothetical protein
VKTTLALNLQQAERTLTRLEPQNYSKERITAIEGHWVTPAWGLVDQLDREL